MEATIYDRTSAAVDGERIEVPDGQNVYTAILQLARAQAAGAQRPIRMLAEDLPRGTTDHLLIHPDGRVEHPEQGPVPPAAPSEAMSAPPQPPGPPAILGGHSPSRASGDLALSFVRERKKVSQHGWRRLVRTLTGGAVALGLSPTEQRHEALVEQVRTRAARPATVVVMCLKGGIGKTSTTAGVGLTLARHRGDRVIALDANPDAGDLYERTCGGPAPATLTDLADRVNTIKGTTDLAQYTGIAERLAVIAGDQEPTISESLSAEDFVSALHVVQRYYNVVLVDCGTGVTHPSMVGILGNADRVIIAGGYAVSGARRAENTLRWLHANGYAALARSAVVVLTQTANVSAVVDRSAIEAALARLSATVITVPNDQAVADGATIDLDRLAPATRDAYLEIAAAVASTFR